MDSITKKKNIRLIYIIDFFFFLAILHFRFFHNDNKRVLKIQHGVIHCCIIIIAAFGIWAGLSSNIIAKPPVPKFYSLHSWLGIVTIVIFVVQVGYSIFKLFFFFFVFPFIFIYDI